MHPRVVSRPFPCCVPFAMPAAHTASAVNPHRDIAAAGCLCTTGTVVLHAGGDKLVGGVHGQLIGHFVFPLIAATGTR
jgi:hypothetical protein